MLSNQNISPNKSTSESSELLKKKKERTKKTPSDKKGRTKTNDNYSVKDEERILKYALKISEMEYREKASKEDSSSKSTKKMSYSDIEPCSTIIATEEDFKDPIAFLDRVWSKEKSTGIIKIIPPNNWREMNKELFDRQYTPKFNESDRKLDTRKIVLNELHKAKKFEFVKDFTFQEYVEKAIKTQESIYENKFGTVQKSQIEEDFWKIVEDSSTNLDIQYAADIPINKYFSKTEMKDIEEKMEKAGAWPIFNINSQKHSLLDNLGFSISGVTLPWIYFGMIFSTFCWHTEDLYLYSLNYMHKGHAKIWYGIPHEQKEKMDNYIKNKYYATLLKCPDLVHRLTVFINPLELIANGIKVYKAVQNEGDIILTLPKGYHSGFSTGLNCAEAINFSSTKWLDYGLMAENDYRKQNKKIGVFPLDWLILRNIDNSGSEGKVRTFTSEQELELNTKAFNTIKAEIENRITIELLFKENKINYKIEEIAKSDDYEKFSCDLCVSYGYLSVLICNNCKRKSCISHLVQCKCLPTDFSLHYRYSMKELQNLKKLSSEGIKRK